MDKKSVPTVNPEEEIEYLLEYAINEITGLRRITERLRSRVQVYDDMISVFKGVQPKMSYSAAEGYPDILVKIKMKLEQLKFNKFKKETK